MSAEPRVVLHPSLARLGLSVAAPLLLLGLGGVAVLDGGLSPGPAVLLGLGGVLLLVVLVDIPYRVDFDGQGLTRHCLVRRHRLPWTQVAAITRTRTRPGLGELVSSGRRAAAASNGATPRVGRRAALVARRGARSNVLLVDRCESHAEWTLLRDLLRDRATSFSAPPPPVDHPPAGRGPRAVHARR